MHRPPIPKQRTEVLLKTKRGRNPLTQARPFASKQLIPEPNHEAFPLSVFERYPTSNSGESTLPPNSNLSEVSVENWLYLD